MKHSKKSAGQRGGLATLAKHGREHFAKIGQRGAAEFHKRYRLDPFGLNDFAIVRRDTGDVISFLSGRPF